MEASGKTKSAILAQYAAVLAVAQKNRVPMPALSAQMEELQHLILRVPMIGALNTGKSTLLNALLGYPLLPSAPTAKTLVPTELLYGEPLLMVQRDGTAHRAGLGELRSQYFDAAGVRGLQAFYPSPLLQVLDGLQLVDMPSFDVTTGEQAAVLQQYLAQSFGCVLLISAEEPVLKESVCRCLAALRLREMPFYIVLTKCDKVTPDACEEGVRFCMRALQEQLQVENVPVVCAQTKPTPKVAAVQQLLEGLNSRAEALCYVHYSDKLTQYVVDLIAMLELLSLQKEAAVIELERRTQGVQQRSAELECVIVDWENDVLQSFPSCQETLAAQLQETLVAFSPVLETEIMARRAEAEKSRGEILSLANALVKSELEPMLQAHLRSLQATLAYQFAQQGGELPTVLARSFVEWNADVPFAGAPVLGGAVPDDAAQPADAATLMTCLAQQMQQTQLTQALAQFYAALPAKPQAERVRDLVQQALLPQLLQALKEGLDQTLLVHHTQLCAQIREIFRARCDELSAQLQQTMALCGNQKSQQQQSLSQITQDIAALRAILQAQ